MNRRSSNVSAAGLRHSRGPWKRRFMVPRQDFRVWTLDFMAYFQLTTLSLFAPLSALPLGLTVLLGSTILSGPADQTITGAFTS